MVADMIEMIDTILYYTILYYTILVAVTDNPMMNSLQFVDQRPDQRHILILLSLKVLKLQLHPPHIVTLRKRTH
jgi:hypothetical protein